MDRIVLVSSPGETMYRETMKFLFTIVPWLLLVASGYSFTFGFSRLARRPSKGTSTFDVLLDALAAVDSALVYVGIIGAVTAIGFFATRSQFRAQTERIRRLERELDKASGGPFSGNRHAENTGHRE
jgi:hypothetical protein